MFQTGMAFCVAARNGVSNSVTGRCCPQWFYTGGPNRIFASFRSLSRARNSRLLLHLVNPADVGKLIQEQLLQPGYRLVLLRSPAHELPGPRCFADTVQSFERNHSAKRSTVGLSHVSSLSTIDGSFKSRALVFPSLFHRLASSGNRILTS